MKKEYSKKKIWGSVTVGLVLAMVLVMLVGFGGKPDTEEKLSPSASPAITLSSSRAEATPTPKPSASPKASPSPKVKATPKVELKRTVKAEKKEPVSVAKSHAEQAAPTYNPIPQAQKAPASTPTPAVPAAVSTPQPTVAPTPTPKPKEKVWVVDVPASTQQVWVEEQGHWEDRPYLTSDWVYQCNGCGQTFPTTGEVDAHQWAAFDNGEDHGGYTMTSGPMYEVSEQVWVVDVEGHYETVTTPEQGHWEYQ